MRYSVWVIAIGRIVAMETFNRRFIYFGWTTQNPSEQFASDWPAKHLANMSEEESANGPAHQAAMADGVMFLDHKEFAGW